MRGRGLLRAAAVVAGTLIITVPAGAATRSGGGTDDPDDYAVAGLNITSVAMDYDESGAFTARATLRGPVNDADNGALWITAGTRQPDGTCGTPGTLMAVALESAAPGFWRKDGTGAYQPLTAEISGPNVKLTGNATPGAFDCTDAVTTEDSTTPTNRYDTAGPFALAAPTPPPPPPPPPVPAPAPAPAPAPKPVPAPPPPGVKLTIEAPQLATLARNRWQTVKLRVANSGTKAASKVQLKLTTARGVQASRRTVTFKRIRSGKKGTATIRLRLTKRAKASSVVKARASAKGAEIARSEMVLKLKTKARKRVKGPSRGKAPETLVGKAFTYVKVDVMAGNDWQAYYFVNDKFAHRGIPEGGIPECPAATAQPESDGDPGKGCIPYTFDPKTGAVTLDGVPGQLDAARTTMKVGENEFTLAVVPKPGLRWAASLRGISVWGFWPNQTVNQRWLTTNMNGEFMLEKSTMGQMGTTNFAVAPPDSRGTYEVLPNGTFRMTFADGKVENWTMTILRDPKTGDENPATAEFLLDDMHFFVDDD